jgi:hypothetical protein
VRGKSRLRRFRVVRQISGALDWFGSQQVEQAVLEATWVDMHADDLPDREVMISASLVEAV